MDEDLLSRSIEVGMVAPGRICFILTDAGAASHFSDTILLIAILNEFLLPLAVYVRRL